MAAAPAQNQRECRPFYDLREFIAAIDQAGQLKRIDGADWDLEIGAIAEVTASRPKAPALLFDNIRGYPPGYRVMCNLTSIHDTFRERLIYGCPLSLSDAEALRFWKDQLKKFTPIPP